MAAVQQLLTKEERGNGGPARCAARWRRKRGPGCAAGAGGGKNPGAAARQRGSRGRRRGGGVRYDRRSWAWPLGRRGLTVLVTHLLSNEGH
jgi:hypothetical protein